MGKIKIIFFSGVILFVGLVFGFFLSENKYDIMVDLLYKSELVEVGVGRFALSFFIAGLLVAFVLCVGMMFIQNLELRSARKQIRGLTAQLDKLRE